MNKGTYIIRFILLCLFSSASLLHAQVVSPDELYTPPAQSIFNMDAGANKNIRNKKQRAWPSNNLKWNVAPLARGIFLLEYERELTRDFSIQPAIGLNFNKDLVYYLIGVEMEEEYSGITGIEAEGMGYTLGLEIKYWEDIFDGFYYYLGVRHAVYALEMTYNRTVAQPLGSSNYVTISEKLSFPETANSFYGGWGQGFGGNGRLSFEYSLGIGLCFRQTSRLETDNFGYVFGTPDRVSIPHFSCMFNCRFGGLF